MSRLCCRLAILLLLGLVPIDGAGAASLTVSPILIEIGGGASGATVTLRNREVRPVNAQVRVFRWTQVEGADRLDPADDVVASPPIVSVEAGADYTVRLQRLGADEPKAEQAYRVVVDELPNPNRQRNGTIAVVLRYLVPAFVLSADASQPRLVWWLKTERGQSWLAARNAGDKRIQIVDLALKAPGRTAWVGRGLAGYVLGHSERDWPVPAQLGRIGAAWVIAKSDHGPINARLEH